jgi:hypothetical protein
MFIGDGLRIVGAIEQFGEPSSNPIGIAGQTNADVELAVASEFGDDLRAIPVSQHDKSEVLGICPIATMVHIVPALRQHEQQRVDC